MPRRIDSTVIAYIVALFAAAGSSPARPFASQPNDSMGRWAQASPGQAVTPLADGRLLVTGGEGSLGSAEIRDPATGLVSPLPALGQGRAWHSMTILPDGRVFVFGGVDETGQALSAPEIFDPGLKRFEFAPNTMLQPRARHSATLLTDGQVLLAGGSANGSAAASIDLWNSADRTANTDAAVLTQPRVGHMATIQPDGTVRLSGGTDVSGVAVTIDEVFDPDTAVLQSQAHRGDRAVGRQAVVSGMAPSDGASNVPTDSKVAVRFDRPATFARGVNCCVALEGPEGVVPALSVPTEGGRLWFLTPFTALTYATSYQVLVSGAVVATFQTTGPPEHEERGSADPEIWNPSVGSAWKTGRPASPLQSLPPLSGPTGISALAGQVLSVSGLPLEGVTVAVGAVTGQTDATGRFVIAPLSAGTQVLEVHGHSVSPSRRDYGMHEIQVDIAQGRTAVLPFTIWLSPIDQLSGTSLVGPQAKTARNHRVPGLEVSVSAGTALRERTGRVLESLSITPLPVDRAPVPTPPGVQALALFSLQTHGAQVTGGRSSRVSLVYPNTLGLPPGSAVDLWTYDARRRGWAVTGRGTVNPDGRRVSSVIIASSDSGSDSGSGGSGSGGSGSGGNSGPGGGGSGSGSVNCLQLASSSSMPSSGPMPGDGESAGDPVDMGTGLFVYNKTDLTLPDVLPLVLTRTYRQNDATSRAFGIGSSHPYDLILTGDFGEQFADLVLPDGGALHFVRTSPGTGHVSAVMLHTATRTSFYKSVLTWNTSRPGWDISLTDGSIYKFGTVAATGARLVGIADRYGNEITIERNGIQIRRIVSPNGRLLEFTYDGSDRVTQVKDSIGRTVAYSYDGSGRLSQVTDAGGGVTQFTYDPSHRMLTVTDPRSITYLTNVYDGSGRVDTQTQADSGAFDFSYTVNGSGAITQTDVVNPRGYTRRATFANQLPVTTVLALGESIEQTTSYARVSGSPLVQAVTDALGRVTRFTYDTNGRATSIVSLYGTVDAVEVTRTYESTFGQIASLTDPLSHTTSIAYDGQGRITSVTDPLSHQTTFTTNASGQPLSVTNPLSQVTTFTYDLGDLTTVLSPAGNSSTRFVDAVGRMVRAVDPLGRITRVEYNALDLVTKVIDPLGGETAFTYDGNGNLLTLTDARGKTTTRTYNNMDRVATRTDPLSRLESFTYDLNGNLATWTDRKGQVTTYTYDALDRATFTGFGTTGTPPSYASSVTTTYDAGDRATTLVDSGAGTISRTYDLLDRMTEEVTPEGTVTYTYDAAGRRSTMQVVGQTSVSYTYDNANRLTAITQGTASVSMIYDSTNRRTSHTLPNGIVVEYVYDADGQLAGLTYKLSGTTIGSLTYAYDASGQRTAVGGTSARSNLPAALTSAIYDDANQIATWAGTSFSYDANGSVTSDGAKSYTWNARNELTALSGGVSASFAYDGVGRRRAKMVATSTTQFLYDGPNPVQELASGAPTANLLTELGIDEFFTRTDSTGTRHFLSDALGSSIALTDGSGTIQTSYTYEPFGAATVSGAASGNVFGFTAREADGTGLSYHRARYYDPRLARFITEDPVQFDGGDVNLYRYVGNDPIGSIDPMGLQGFDSALRTASDFSAGIGDALSFNLSSKIRDWSGTNDVVDSCSGTYKAGGWSGLAVGLGIGGSGIVRGGLRIERGNWKQGVGLARDWAFPVGTRAGHFHWGRAAGLQSHHLPYQAGNWFKNLGAAISRGKAGSDLGNMAATLYSAGIATFAGFAGRGCGC